MWATRPASRLGYRDPNRFTSRLISVPLYGFQASLRGAFQSGVTLPGAGSAGLVSDVPNGTRALELSSARAFLHWKGGEAAVFSKKFPSDSDLSHSAVYIDFHAGDVGRVLGGQKRNRTGHFLGLSEALHGNLGNGLLGELLNGFLG
jgi:hypothetical protein